MKIDVDPGVIGGIAVYCEEQNSVLKSTRDYLNEHAELNSLDLGLLLMILNPFYDLCRKFTMNAFTVGAKLVESRGTAMRDYLKEQTALEAANENVWKQMGGALENSGKGMNAGNGASGGGGQQFPGGAGFGGAFGSPGFGTPGFGAGAGGEAAAGDPLNPQPLPPVDNQAGEPLNPQPLPPGPPDEMAGRMQHMQQSADPLNPQPLPPGPPDAISHRPEVMDQVWQERAAEDPLGRSPAQLQSMWEARQSVQPPPVDDGLMNTQMHHAMDTMGKTQQMAANVMKIVSDAQMQSLAGNLK